MSRGRYPDFLGIGAAKSGTSWLDVNLRAHPELWLPPEKELHYFDHKVKLHDRPRWARFRDPDGPAKHWRRQLRRRLAARRSARSMRGVGWDLRFFLGRGDDAWYASLFAPAGGRVAGEVTPGYAVLKPHQVEHVADLIPDARIIFLIRNPIERAWSHAGMYVHRTSEGPADRAFLHLEGEYSQSRSSYQETLRSWRAYYPDDRIFLGFLEDVYFHPEALLRRIYAFLGVDHEYTSPFPHEKVHRGSTTLPSAAARRLAELYTVLIDDLDETFGGYATWWRFCRDRLLVDGPDGDLVSPFFEGPLWNEWLQVTGAEEPPLQSATLAEFPMARGVTTRRRR
jgi:hypothetical protein